MGLFSFFSPTSPWCAVLGKHCMLIVLLSPGASEPVPLLLDHCLPPASHSGFWGCDISRSIEMFSVKVKLKETWYLLQFVLSGRQWKWERRLDSLQQQQHMLGSASGPAASGELVWRAGNTAWRKIPNFGLNQNKKPNQKPMLRDCRETMQACCWCLNMTWSWVFHGAPVHPEAYQELLLPQEPAAPAGSAPGS